MKTPLDAKNETTTLDVNERTARPRRCGATGRAARIAAALTLLAVAPRLTWAAEPGGAPPPPSSPRRSMEGVYSAFGALSYWYPETGLGGGVRYQKTLLPDGVLKLASVRDDIGVEGGVDYLHYSSSTLGLDWNYHEFALVAGAVWNFWLTDRLAVYPKLELAERFGVFTTNSGASSDGLGGLTLAGAAGVIYRLDKVSLRAEAGSGSLRLGVGFTL